jgi:UDP-3-O-[3-hydroxymyristoyl] glucosamine N-acyltransferase
MKLSDFFEKEKLIRNVEFFNTYCPFYVLKKSIGYVQNENIIEKINKDENVVGVITYEKYKDRISILKGVVISDNPQYSYYLLHNRLVKENYLPSLHKNFISSSSIISKTATIGKNVFIGDNVQINHGVVIHDNSYIDDGTKIEDYAIIGAKGMQDTSVRGEQIDVHYAGGVKIGKNCQILAQAIIQKPYQPFYTKIADNCKISVKTVVGHGSQIGSNTMIAGNSQISGNVKIGNFVVIGPSTTISDNIQIGNNANVKIGSVVIKDINSNEIISGNFALNHNKNLKNYFKSTR